ncbi:uncharacterized protein LOC143296924 [Babylonia areolata]|uniref:uncharacterized protein LOC143296924 n=1 Tax=Babylonia areolata TaxID=304850 RepID=UPI003FD376DB
MMRNTLGETPILVAALKTKEDFVEFLLAVSDCSRDDRANALEVLGTGCWTQDRAERCLELWERAMKVRHQPGRPLAEKRLAEHTGKMTTALPASTFSENQAMCQCYQTPCIRIPNETLDRAYWRKRLPPAFRFFLEILSRELLTNSPKDTYTHSARFFEELLIQRDTELSLLPYESYLQKIMRRKGMEPLQKPINRPPPPQAAPTASYSHKCARCGQDVSCPGPYSPTAPANPPPQAAPMASSSQKCARCGACICELGSPSPQAAPMASSSQKCARCGVCICQPGPYVEAKSPPPQAAPMASSSQKCARCGVCVCQPGPYVEAKPAASRPPPPQAAPMASSSQKCCRCGADVCEPGPYVEARPAAPAPPPLQATPAAGPCAKCGRCGVNVSSPGPYVEASPASQVSQAAPMPSASKCTRCGADVCEPGPYVQPSRAPPTPAAPPSISPEPCSRCPRCGGMRTPSPNPSASSPSPDRTFTKSPDADSMGAGSQCSRCGCMIKNPVLCGACGGGAMGDRPQVDEKFPDYKIIPAPFEKDAWGKLISGTGRPKNVEDGELVNSRSLAILLDY